MFEKNYEVLKQLVAEHAVIRHVSKHRLPDGTFDLEGNMKLWNDAIARLELIPLWAEGAPNFDAAKTPLQPEPSIAFIPAQGVTEPRGTVIVACGGGFTSRTGCEGMNPALYLADRGFNTAILTYRLDPYTRIDAMDDMQRAIRLLRARKDELGITDKVAAMGFSAGGMLSGNCATHFDFGDDETDDPIERQSCRPDAAVVAYGAFAPMSFPLPFGGRGVMKMFGRDRREQMYLSLEHNVSVDCCPFFIWQTNSDDPRNAFALGSALQAAGVPFELHCFPDGRHGMCLGDGENDLAMDIPHVAHWAELCAEWLRSVGI